MVKESVIQKQYMDRIIREFPEVYLRKIAAGPFSHGGIPDLIGCLNGRFFAIEVKTETGTISKLQQHDMNIILMANGRYFIGKPSNIEEIISGLRILNTEALRFSAGNN